MVIVNEEIMMKLIRIIQISIVFLFSITYVPITLGNGSDCYLLPEDLLKIAHEKGFYQIKDFYKNRPGMLNPPYVYGYFPGPKENSAVFWCENKENTQRRFFLVIVSKDEIKKSLNCDDIIEWPNYPGGLTILQDTNIPLDGFVYLDDPKRNGPENTYLTHNAILSEYDGVEVIFYCLNGEWLVRVRH